ncbi:MAG: hypothetical protein U5R30_09540 [Deltaproteobacteria bacterium]|nr:hypothetical protein [Deltaproteobacteria bacterium]
MKIVAQFGLKAANRPGLDGGTDLGALHRRLSIVVQTRCRGPCCA